MLLPANAWELFWPPVLIAIGVPFLAGVVTGGAARQSDTREVAHGFSILGAHRLISESEQFRSASLTAFFGGVALDLRQAKLAPEGAGPGCHDSLRRGQHPGAAGGSVQFTGIPISGGFDD